jgi:N4-gp56 family major capsid protein
MADTQLAANALSGAITFKVQKKILENLRNVLLWDNDAYAERGTFLPGFDTLRFVSVPDLTVSAASSFNFTEGSRPDKKALTISTVDVSTQQYGSLMAITDIAKVKSPLEIVSIASERLSREAGEVLDVLNRDVIAAGGTAFYATESNGDANTTRDGISATAKLKMNDLRLLRAKMTKANIPTFGDGFYRVHISAEQGYDLRNDTTSGSNFVEVNKYATPETILRGELGRLEGFRIMETNRLKTATNASSVSVHLGIALGDVKGWGCGDIQSLQTYHVAPGGDHTDPLGTEELMGWKVNYGCAVLNNSYYFRVESAVTSLA